MSSNVYSPLNESEIPRKTQSAEEDALQNKETFQNDELEQKKNSHNGSRKRVDR